MPRKPEGSGAALFVAAVSVLSCAGRGLAADMARVSRDGLWRIAAGVPREHVEAEPWSRPDVFQGVSLKQALLKQALNQAPMEFTEAARTAPLEIMLPMPDGSFARFAIVESPIMEPPLAKKFPRIKTYMGHGIDDRAATVRLDWTPTGFHAQMLSPDGVVYIDPYTKGNTSFYASYYKRDYGAPAEPFQCLTTPGNVAAERNAAGATLASTGDTLRTYRLACAATGEYTARFGGTVDGAMAAIVTAVNRVTGVYEVETAVRMVLIANNDLIVYTNAATDPYSNGNGMAMLGENQANLDSVIGSANYDIGHVFSTGGGGVAYLRVTCTSSKARGVTGLSNPVGDPFYIDYVAHEMGHQFGGNHTFNGVTWNCSGGNRYGPAAYEPGSGSTIMAYAGICGFQDDLQNNSDAYFHSESYREIANFVRGSTGGSCSVTSATGNDPPTVDAGPDLTIPMETPFTLTASGGDPNGDDITFNWEERDLGPAQQARDMTDNGSSPLFRSFYATTDPSRTFPKWSDILSNTTTIGEVLPSTSRTLRFRVTARDNREGGGGVATDDMQITVDGSRGPFRVTSPNGAVTLAGTQEVTWDVAGTDTGSINVSSVTILLSTDAGLTFPVTLAANTPNDGIEEVALPTSPTNAARIKVEAVDNIFFDVSDANFTIVTIGMPAAEPGGPSCSYDSQCTGTWTGAACVEGTCYAPKNRYVTIDPTVNGMDVAYRVTVTEASKKVCSETRATQCTQDADCPIGETCEFKYDQSVVGTTWWLEDPVCKDYWGMDCPSDSPGQHPAPCLVPDDVPISRCSAVDTNGNEWMFGWYCGLGPRNGPVPPARLWTEVPLHIGDCVIAPVMTYEVAATDDGGVSFGLPLEVMTIRQPDKDWSDVTGGADENGLWSPPNASTNVTDLQAIVMSFEQDAAGFVPYCWADMDGNQTVNMTDIQWNISAFEQEEGTTLWTDLSVGDPADCP